MTHLSKDDARAYMVGQCGLRAVVHARGDAGIRQLLLARRCIQLDPIDTIGTNPDLVAAARVDGIQKGQVFSALLPGHAFEHFAKERCLLPAHAFPYYRDQSVETPWWRLSERLKRLSPEVLDAVEHEVERRGPITAAELEDRGRVDPLDWHGWKGTSKTTSMALRVLWTQCRLVVHSRIKNNKRYSAPATSLGEHAASKPKSDFARWALLQRVEACGLLSRADGPQWSMLYQARKTLPDKLIAEGLLEEVRVEGSSRPYLAPTGFRDRQFPEDDGRMRILGPLDPLLWDRKLVRQAFGFEYIWEVYKPAEKRRWGWYVCPLLHRGRLIGRLEGRTEGETLTISRIWDEGALDRDALDLTLSRHAEFLGLRHVEIE